MKRKMLFWLVLIIVLGPVCAQENQQDIDVSPLSGKDWSKKKIFRSVEWYKLKDNELFGEPQSINVIKINLKKNEYDVSVVFSDSTRVLLSEMATKQKALAAINGTFFDMKKGGSVVFLKSGDKIITSPNPDAPVIVREAAFTVGDSVRIAAFPKNDWKNWQANYKEIMVSGPLLIKQGECIEPDSTAFTVTKHPRSAIGITSDYELLFVTADGRHENKASGLSIKELGLLMKALNCKDAMNLDGGGSTTLWSNKKGVLNFPSDNKVFDHEGARTIANGIIISKN
ncbi:phosphodiester glycosidase family protein [Draconibacterium sp. IB214405]|uniref:phosphodiester glycosidase family protein n=1 Tax=Draconibacterium sp. IB214405 TaxID=3097352 RepID=UPI002A0FB08E|nr:phosphodiester glycosidase family protein [Draconibacterium sp. IB214405]MDX8338802.1 phosphodiester glycosidase family protein [Draconibacterium sp. IB214405]